MEKPAVAQIDVAHLPATARRCPRGPDPPKKPKTQVYLAAQLFRQAKAHELKSGMSRNPAKPDSGPPGSAAFKDYPQNKKTVWGIG